MFHISLKTNIQRAEFVHYSEFVSLIDFSVYLLTCKPIWSGSWVILHIINRTWSFFVIMFTPKQKSIEINRNDCRPNYLYVNICEKVKHKKNYIYYQINHICDVSDMNWYTRANQKLKEAMLFLFPSSGLVVLYASFYYAQTVLPWPLSQLCQDDLLTIYKSIRVF